MSRFSKNFVSIVFSLLAISFLVSTGSVVLEFRDSDLATILTANSYLFVFFPTLGIVALAAFYTPAVIFTDLYWSSGSAWLKTRFTIGTLAAIGASLWFADHLDSTDKRAVWEISPAALADNAARPARCMEGNRLCVQPILPTLQRVRSEALGRLPMSVFARSCQNDEMLEANPDTKPERYCFPAAEKLNAEQCCRVSHRFAQTLLELWSQPGTRSETARLDRYLLPFKCFFVIVIVVIGVMLVIWKKTLKEQYGPWLRDMERGLQIGAIAMLAWPVMDYAYQLVSDLLYGQDRKLPLRLSLVMLPWVLLLTFHFRERLKEDARLFQILGSAASAVAFLFRYQDISDWSMKLVGIGATVWNLVIVALLSLAITVLLCIWLRATVRISGRRQGRSALLQRDDDPSPIT